MLRSSEFVRPSRRKRRNRRTLRCRPCPTDRQTAKASPLTEDRDRGWRVLRWLRPCSQVATVYDIDLSALRARGIRGVILDLDNTIVPWGAREISPRLP